MHALHIVVYDLCWFMTHYSFTLTEIFYASGKRNNIFSPLLISATRSALALGVRRQRSCSLIRKVNGLVQSVIIIYIERGRQDS